MADQVVIAFYGDSLTEGYGLRDKDALPSVLQKMLAEQDISAKCLNFGISGDTSDDGLLRLKQVQKVKPNAVVIEFGANDFWVGDDPEFIKDNLRAMIEPFRKTGTPVLLVGIKALADAPEEYRAEFNPIFRSLADEYSLPLYPDILAPYFGNPSLTLIDGLHPSEAGVIAIARDMLPMITELANQALRLRK